MDTELLLRLHSQLLRIRMVEEAIAEVYPAQEIRCPVHLCTGQEAVAVGVCANLMPEDYVLSGHRSHGHYLAKGGDLRAMIAEMYGKATGCCGGKGGSMHLVDLAVGFLGATAIVASTIPIAVGAALAATMRGESRVAVAFFGDGAVEEGVLYESLNFASLRNLPVLFVCEHNFYSVYSPLPVRQPATREIYQLAQAHGMESHQGDGNDVAEVYSLAQQAVVRARAGAGPTFLELKTYRWREHCGPHYDNDLGYRSDKEFLEWRRRCPVEVLQEQLLREGALSSDDLADLTARVQTEIAQAFAFAKQSPEPTPTALCAGVYQP